MIFRWFCNLYLLYLIKAKNEFEYEKIRIHDLLIPLYAYCNSSVNNMGTSMLLSLKDFLLNDKFLLLLYEAYRDINWNDDNLFLNYVSIKECIHQKIT